MSEADFVRCHILTTVSEADVRCHSLTTVSEAEELQRMSVVILTSVVEDVMCHILTTVC